MPEPPPDIPITITYSVAFALPCPASIGIAYLSDPSILLGALPSVERAVARQRGTYRLTLSPISTFGRTFRPAAEVTITATSDRVVIRSEEAAPHALQDGEVPTQVDGTFRVTGAATRCDVHATLRLGATIPPRAIPPLMPRALAQRTAEGILSLRMRQEIHATARALVAGFSSWNAEQQSATRTDGSQDEQPASEH